MSFPSSSVVVVAVDEMMNFSLISVLQSYSALNVLYYLKMSESFLSVLITYSISGVLLSVFVILAAWVSKVNMLPVLPVLVASVIFLFLVFFFSVDITLGKKLFCFFTSIMLGAFCLLYSIVLMASFEAINDLWESTRLLTIEVGLVSLGLSALILIAFFKMLTKDLPMLLREERINGMWDFLFLIPFMALLLISWLTPEYPKYLLVGRYRIIALVVLTLIPLITYLIFIAAKLNSSTSGLSCILLP